MAALMANEHITVTGLDRMIADFEALETQPNFRTIGKLETQLAQAFEDTIGEGG
jgi:hypothetical protein